MGADIYTKSLVGSRGPCPVEGDKVKSPLSCAYVGHGDCNDLISFECDPLVGLASGRSAARLLFRSGSKAEILTMSNALRYSPESGHRMGVYEYTP